MNDPIRYRFGDACVDLPLLHAWLRESYWAAARPMAQIACSVRNSFCISAWDGERMVGFARLVTDYATQAYLCDVIVDPAWRRRGIGRPMVRSLVMHEAVATCRITLHTVDAHGVYTPLGFAAGPGMAKRPRRAWNAQGGS